MNTSAPIPAAFLFRFRFSVQHRAALPKTGSQPLRLSKACQLPQPSSMQGLSSFGDLRMAWNDKGLGISAEVRNKQTKVSSDRRQPTETDGLQLWIDTRDTQNIHRASQFCHHLCVLPAPSTRPNADPILIQQPIARAKREPPPLSSSETRVATQHFSDGYRVEVWLDASDLHGFAPDVNPRLGFYYCLRDRDHGEQFLTVDHEFPFAFDPSVWSTVELTR